MPDFPSSWGMTGLVVQTFALFVVPSLGRAQDMLAWGAVVIVGALGYLSSLVAQTFALLIVSGLGWAQDVLAWGAVVIVGALGSVGFACMRFACVKLGC